MLGAVTNPRLTVVDGSVIGANLGVNPSLTITAISEYAMSLVLSKSGLKTKPAPFPERVSP